MRNARHPATALLAALPILLAPRDARAQEPLVPVGVAWPTRTAVGMVAGQLGPMVVEARSDGWVVVTPLSTRPDAGLESPTQRLVVRATDVLSWRERVRVALRSSTDIAYRDSLRAAGMEIPVSSALGTGRLSFDAWIPLDRDGRTPHFTIRGCGNGSHGSSPGFAEIARFAELLERAAKLAGPAPAREPALDRPYYAGEVSCPATPDTGNAVPRHPGGRGGDRVVTVGVRMVVDTTGRIEPGSFAVLPGTDRRSARAVREAARTWRFTPAEVDGLPVRQVVQLRVEMDPRPRAVDTAVHAISFRGEHDGWVRLEYAYRYGAFGHPRVTREWVRPDSLERWAALVGTMRVDSAAALERLRPNHAGGPFVMIGSAAGVRYLASYYRTTDRELHPGGTIVACAGSSSSTAAGMYPQRIADAQRAARDARAMRATPSDPARTVHDIDDVACPAWLPWARARHATLATVWQYPTMPYPPSMAPANAMAEVMASFVVDTAGVPEPRTLQVMAGSDPRAVAALRGSIGELRFRPATRGGVRVPQRVIRVMLFEAPVTCGDRNDGPACTRRYGPGTAGTP